MPLTTAVAAHRVSVDAFVTDTEFHASPNFVLAYLRERVREELADRIRELGMRMAEVPGGRRYTMDILLLTPDELIALVEHEAKLLIERLGYAHA